MSATSGDRPVGRPPGPDPETQARIRRIRMMASGGLSAAMIAECEGISERYARLLMRAPDESPGGASDEQASPRYVRAPRTPPRRLTEQKLTHHAVLAIKRDTRLRRFDPATKLFWLDCVMEIHALGDEDGLPFGADGDPFESHADFAAALGGSADDLEAFLRRGLLVRLPDGGIDLPVKIGLKPREKARSLGPVREEQPLARAFGGGFDGSETPSFDGTETPSDGSETPPFRGSEIPPRRNRNYRFRRNRNPNFASGDPPRAYDCCC